MNLYFRKCSLGINASFLYVDNRSLKFCWQIANVDSNITIGNGLKKIVAYYAKKSTFAINGLKLQLTVSNLSIYINGTKFFPTFQSIC